MTLSSRERVYAALAHEPVDRVPIFLWFHPETVASLSHHFGVPPETVDTVMANDVRQAWVGNNFAMEGVVHEHEQESHVDAWGIEWVRSGPFNQIRRSPLADADAATLAAYEFPTDHIDELLKGMGPVAVPNAEWFVGCDVSPCLFEIICRLRGMEGAALDLAADPPSARRLYERAADFCVRLATAACDRYSLDWLWTGDDVGSQKAMIMSPSCWRARIRPHLERIFEVGKARGLKIAYHSCGAIRPIIPDLIEMGLDVLNPVQCNCPGMDAAELKREFGRHITFMGGIDTQELLPRGSAADVRHEADRMLTTMTADGGGYILAGSHSIPPETPIENIFALYESAGLSREALRHRAINCLDDPRPNT